MDRRKRPRLARFVAWAGMVLVAAQGLPASLGFAVSTPPTPKAPKAPKSPRQTKTRKAPRKTNKKLAALKRGKAFVKAILNRPFETLPNPYQEEEEQEGAHTPDPDVMRVWRDIPDLYTKETRNIVLRSNTEPFWQSCIDTVNDVDPLSGARYRVCAVGTPGIGKTYTTPLLLRMLLLNGSTVVYIRRSTTYKSWYYEFVPTSNDEHDGELSAAVSVYPETPIYMEYEIPSLDDNSTYFVVDPGRTQENCNPDETFKPGVIIISSPDEANWGAGTFQKLDSKQVGTFKYCPLWSYSEVRRGLVHFSPAVRFSSDQLAERYRQVGGVPRNLIAGELLYKGILKDQDNAAVAVEAWQAQRIVRGNMDPMGPLDSKYPKSAVIGIALDENDGGTFTKQKSVPVSMTVAEKVFFNHIGTLWNDMVLNERPLVFESYLRMVLTTAGYEIKVQHLKEKGNRTPGPATDESSIKLPSTIGNYSGIQIVPPKKSIVKAAIDGPTANILFYSANPNYKLIDFACKNDEGNILAFQATTGSTHTANVTHIADLEGEVGNRTLMLYYLYPARPGGKFATSPPRPKSRTCRIYHVEILEPPQ